MLKYYFVSLYVTITVRTVWSNYYIKSENKDYMPSFTLIIYICKFYKVNFVYRNNNSRTEVVEN